MKEFLKNILKQAYIFHLIYINELINNKTISGGMIPKIKNCLDVATNGVKGVCIIDGRLEHSILFELLSNAGSGTLIRE